VEEVPDTEADQKRGGDDVESADEEAGGRVVVGAEEQRAKGGGEVRDDQGGSHKVERMDFQLHDGINGRRGRSGKEISVMAGIWSGRGCVVGSFTAVEGCGGAARFRVAEQRAAKDRSSPRALRALGGDGVLRRPYRTIGTADSRTNAQSHAGFAGRATFRLVGADPCRESLAA
jgi:hypothetical protein